jgi:hypothetical protein
LIINLLVDHKSACTVLYMTSNTASIHRELLLIDLGNVLGFDKSDLEGVSRVVELINRKQAQGTQVIVAASRSWSSRIAWDVLGVRWLWRSEVGGPNQALLDVLSSEDIGRRFGIVEILSGNGSLSEAVADLARAGAHVRVVVGRGGLSWRLRLAASEVRHLDGFHGMLLAAA